MWETVLFYVFNYLFLKMEQVSPPNVNNKMFSFIMATSLR